ncbi:MAG: cytochrome c oxidase subunit II [Candidatus Nanopelagicaceae bacterium]|nr:cytochrome c oxidase subunit II [Candidatus Nanopelagicaceae bacterium]
MKRFPVLLSLVGLISLSVLFTTASAYAFKEVANTPGSTCLKVGLVAKSGRAQVKCVKSGKKLLWQKVAKRRATSPTPSMSASAKPTSVQSQTPATVPTAQSEYEVNAKGTTWSWSFSYQLDGSKSASLSDSSHSSVLYIPQGKPVHINLKSNDVSHGFWVPGLGIDKEASPDSTVRIVITADKTGVFPGACNIQCGRGHAGMKLSVEVVTETEYLKYLSTLK